MANYLRKNLCGMIAVCLLLLPLAAGGANTKKTVSQVTSAVTLTDDVDYTVTSDTPFGDAGVVNILNTDHAVLILSKVRPSAALNLLADHVQINGAKAVNNTNCQVKLYNQGCIILPYGNSVKPLTVYSEPNFEGTAVNSFGLDHSGGYMNTLTDAKLNNQIRSFKLKRGYMVTFSLRPGGRGYSRCFIAADEDLEVASLPAVMDRKISSYRIFKWYDAGKKNLANYMNKEALTALNVQSSYDWGQGNSSFLPDFEWVPNHIYEDWPSSSTIGSTTQSPHTKNNNEPRNTSDDHPQDLTTILNNWENMMRTGLRLCSPASWDGSDYWNATGFLAQFLDSIDARGWRCDIIDLHCYWAEGSFGNIQNWVNKYKRPVWISEWCWGASWNSNGAFASGVTETQVRDALQRICTNLNGMDYVERYFYWNGERDPSRLYKDGTLTPAGEYYSKMVAPMAYNGKYDFVPKTPKQYAPSKFSSTVTDGRLRLSWYDANGEFNQLMEIEKKDANGNWQTYQTVEQKEEAATYTVDITDDIDADYRIHVVDLDGKEYYSNEDVSVGDQIEVGGQVKYVGGNLILNGDFNYGFAGWTSGEGTALSAPNFEVVKAGGVGGGAYLQCYGNGGLTTASAVKKVIDVEAGTDYLFRTAVRNASATPRFCLTADGTAESKTVVQMKASTTWTRVSQTFNTDTYTKAMIAFRGLAYKAQFDKVELRKLFDTREEAVADGIALARREAAVAAAYQPRYETLNSELTAVSNGLAAAGDAALATIESTIANHLKALGSAAKADSLLTVLEALAAVKCFNYDQIKATLQEVVAGTTIDEAINKVDEVQQQIATYLDFANAATQPIQPAFATATGWETKVGTYTGGDQRLNSDVGGKTCWNAWWSLSAASNPDATMEVRQTIVGLKEGLYALECKATTEHYCISDQHGYLKYGDQTMVTPALTFDYFDLSVGNIWETLTTTPVYVKDDGEITIGFVGSKQGATDGLWHRVGASSAGDNREGWWCATDFTLKYHPYHTRTVVPDQWGVVCLPYSVKPADDMAFYQIAGITADYTRLCLEPIDEGEAGVAFIYKCSGTEACFFEYGQEVTKTTDAPGNVRGFLTSSAVTPQNYYFLQEGQWVKITSSVRNERPAIGNYNGIMRPMTDKSAKPLTVYEAWTGATMPIVGVTDAEKEANDANAEHVGGGTKGDANGDGVADLTDIMAVIDYLSGQETISKTQADVNHDGVVNVADITYIIVNISAE